MKNKNVKIWWEVHTKHKDNDYTLVTPHKTREKARINKKAFTGASKNLGLSKLMTCKILKIEERIDSNGHVYRFNINQ